MTTSTQAADYRRDLDALLVVLLAALVRQWRDEAGLPILLPGVGSAGRREPLSVDEVNRATDVLLAGVPTLIGAYQASAAAIAADFFDEVRASAAVRGRFTAEPVDVRDDARQEILVRWATEPLRRPVAAPGGTSTTTPLARDGRGLGDGLTPGAALGEQDVQAALTRLIGATERQVLRGARDTIAENVDRDPADARWARQAKPGACAFCLVMASRGPVYHSRETAGDEANRYHDDCGCIAVPSWPAAPYVLDDTASAGRQAYIAARTQSGSGDLKTLLAQMRQDTGAR